jgi:hypothetical protein
MFFATMRHASDALAGIAHRPSRHKLTDRNVIDKERSGRGVITAHSQSDVTSVGVASGTRIEVNDSLLNLSDPHVFKDSIGGGKSERGTLNRPV